MHDIYVYDKGQNYDGLGIVGALAASACEYDTAAGEAGEVTLEHPFDELGKWSFLQEGRILKCWVPVRETPLLKMETGTTAQKITRQVYRVRTNGGRLRLRKKPNASSKILARYNPGAEVVKLADAGTSGGHSWYQVSVVKDGQTGYMAATYLEFVRSYTETIEVPGETLPESTDEAGKANWTVRPQLFEIYRKAGNGEGITVHARHISYKLLKNATTYEPTGAVTFQAALNGILENCRIAHDFRAYTDIAETRSDVSWHLVNPIKALLDAETGAAARWSAQVVFDNWDMFFLKRAGRNRGMRIEYGKNLVGVESNADISNTATRIMPVGKNKDGTDLLLPEIYVDSENIEKYDEPLLYVLECSDCKVGDEMTVNAAWEEMRKRAKELIANGCDQPEVSLKVDFLSLGEGEEYAQYREMDKLFMYDEIEAVSLRGYADAKAQVTSMTWDCIHDRVLELGVGSVAASLSTGRLASWQIPSGISGGKITYGSIGASQIGQDAISARHIQADSVNAKALQAESVTAEKIKAGALDTITIEAMTAHIKEIVAGSVVTDNFYAAFAEMLALAVGTITANNIETDALAAVLGEFVKIYADYAGLDFATIKDLTADEFIFRLGVAGEVYIDRLAVTSANIIAAVLGEMVLKGDDGRYYRLHVQADGTISTEQIEVTEGEIASGTTSGGQTIIETTANIRDLNAQTIKGSSAIITDIFADALTAGKITAGQAMIASATIPELSATAIKAIGDSIDLTANSTIRLLIESDEQLRAWFTFAEEGLRTGKAGSTYATLTNDVGFHILQNNETIGSFAKRELRTEAVRVGKVNTTQPRIVMREAPDGGAMFVLEDSE